MKHDPSQLVLALQQTAAAGIYFFSSVLTVTVVIATPSVQSRNIMGCEAGPHLCQRATTYLQFKIS